MRNKLKPLLVGLLVSGLATTAPAQVSNLALGQAKSRLACGAGIVVASVILPNGSLQVTCARPPAESSATTTAATAGATATATVVQVTGLAVPAALATVGVAALLAVVAGGGGDGTTTIPPETDSPSPVSTTTPSTGRY